MNGRIESAFGQIRATPEMKAATVTALGRARQGEEEGQGRRRRLRPALAACAAGLLLVLTWGGYALAVEPVAYISVDMDPSVELSLNRLDRVISATGYNEEAQAVLSALKLEGAPCDRAVAALLEEEARAGYLTDETLPTLTVASEDEARASAVMDMLAEEVERYGAGCYRADMECLSQAHGYGLSFGKYAAFLALTEYEETLTVEDCCSMTMGEICSRIGAYERGAHHGWTDPAAGTEGQPGHHGHRWN